MFSAPVRQWSRLPIVIQAVVQGFLVYAIAGSMAWMAAMMLIPAPWSIAVMVVVLWAYLKYFSGSGWPATTVQTRKLNFRATRLPAEVWRWSLLAGISVVVIVQSGLMVTFRLIEFPADQWRLGYDLGAVPLWLAWLFIVMAACVAGISEELGFRGYMQVPLENRYGSGVGISIAAGMFVLLHFNQGWFAPAILVLLFAAGLLWGRLAYAAGSLVPGMISHAVTDIFNFSYWWTDVAGKFERKPIAQTGLDAHFVISLLVLMSAFALYLWAIRKTRLARA